MLFARAMVLPEELEELVGDLLRAGDDVYVEIFARGRDRGIDLRSEIVEVKHYERRRCRRSRRPPGRRRTSRVRLEDAV
jgi:hypothetical protein